MKLDVSTRGLTLEAIQRADIQEGYAQPEDWRIILRRWLAEALNEPGDRYRRLLSIYSQCLNDSKHTIERELFTATTGTFPRYF